jgi:hypothetical protein
VRNKSGFSSMPVFWAYCLHCRHRYRTHDLPCRKWNINRWHTIGQRGKWLFFLIWYRHKVKKGKKLKTLRQNNAVLRRAALSGPKPAPDRAR